ncbi:hypothetical protein ACQ4PT_054791 [Festuca glaucescens]
MHADLRFKLKGMWKTFFTSSMNRMGHVLVDQMCQMVSVLSNELKNQTCTCKGKQLQTENVVAQTFLRLVEGNDEGGCSTHKLTMSQKDDDNLDIDSDDYVEPYEEEHVPIAPLSELLFSNVLQASKTDIEGNEKILEVGGKCVSWHSFYHAMKGCGFVDPSVMDVFLKCQGDELGFLFIPSSLAEKLDVDEDDPTVLGRYLSDHDVSFMNLKREEVYITCCDKSHWWVIFVDFHFRKFRVSSSLELTEAQMATTERIADIESFRKFFTGYMLTYDKADHLASFVRERIEEFHMMM